MPGPSTSQELAHLVERSQVADRGRIEQALDAWRRANSSEDSAALFAQHLIDAGVITAFHAEQLLAGRYKGFKVGAYRILRLIGVGGMGRVYLAEHVFMKRRVALKILPKSQNRESSAIERFQREAQAVAALNHPNIVHAYDSGQEGDVFFLAMEYVPGESVQDYVKRFGRVPWPYAADYIRQAADGLQHAAESGLVHRDIKPGNLLIDVFGVVKLLDLGLAIFFTEPIEGDPLTLRYNENVLGTADYLAPEQAVDSHNIDIRADIYSLGGTFYYLLTGQAPFPTGTIAQKLLWHQQRDPEPASSLVPDLPKSLEAVLKKMMAKRPEQRFATAAQVAAALAPFSKPHPQAFPPEVLGQFDAGQSRPASKPVVPTPKPTPPSKPGSSSVRKPVASNNDKPQPITGRVQGAVAAPAPTATEADMGMDFLRTDAEAKSPTKRDLHSTTVVAKNASSAMAPSKGSAAALWMGAAVVSVVVIGGLVVFALMNRPNPGGPPSTELVYVGKKPADKKVAGDSELAASGDVVVSSAPGHKGPTSVVEGLERVGPNKRVVLAVKSVGDWDVAPLVIGEGKLARLENAHLVGAKPTVTIYSQTVERPMLKITGVKGFVIKDLTIDGSGRAAPLVVVEGSSVDGCRFENVVFQNFQGDALQIASVRGKSAPVEIKNCRFKGDVTKGRGIAFVASEKDPSSTRNVTVRNCTFIDCAAGVIVQGPLGSASVRECVFANGATGVLFAPGAASALFEELRIENCSFWKLTSGVFFEDAYTKAGKLTVADGLFADVGVPVAGTKAAADNLKNNGAVVDVVRPLTTTEPKPPENAVSIGAAAPVKTVDFVEKSPEKPGFLKPKRTAVASKEAPLGYIGAVAPAQD